jgi:hypothetical protein
LFVSTINKIQFHFHYLRDRMQMQTIFCAVMDSDLMADGGGWGGERNTIMPIGMRGRDLVC